MRKMTPSDLQNPKLKSGYHHVKPPSTGGHGGGQPFCATAGSKSGSGDTWYGPRRETALEAAQDYCDYVNGDPARLTAALKSAGHKDIQRDPIDDLEVQAALGVLRDHRAQKRKTAQGYVYCISDGSAVKVGYSVKPSARVAELQTGNPRPLKLLAAFEGTEEDEARLHQKYMTYNLLLEWFHPTSELLSEFGLSADA